MTIGAPSTRRRALLRYAIALDLVVVATGIALMLPDRPLFIVGAFVVTVAIAAAMTGWRAGLAATALSVVVTTLFFTAGLTALAAIAFGGTAASVAFRRRKPIQPEQPAAARVSPARGLAEELGQAVAAVTPSGPERIRLLRLLMYVGLPALVLVVYTNISDILVRNFGIPSILQPLILLLAIPIVRYREDFRPGAVMLQPLTLFLAGYCAVVFTSSNWAADTSFADQRVMDLLKSLVILIVAASLATSWKALRAALAALAGGAALLAVLAIVQAVAGNAALQFGGLAAVEEGHIFDEVYELRAAGPVGDPNVFAQILLIVLPTTVFLALSARDRDHRMAYFAAAAAITAGLLLTYSRGVMVALAVVVLLILMAMRIRLTWAKALVVAAILVATLPTDFGRRFLTIAQVITADDPVTVLDPSIEERRVFAAVALRMFADHPVLGVGAGNYTSHYWPYAYEVGSAARRYDPLGKREQPHSLYLEIASETGLLGLLAFGSTMVVALVALYRSRSDLLRRGQIADAAIVTGIAIAVVGYLVSAVFLHAGVQRYLWLILGFAVAAVRLTTAPPPGDEVEPVPG